MQAGYGLQFPLLKWVVTTLNRGQHLVRHQIKSRERTKAVAFEKFALDWLTVQFSGLEKLFLGKYGQALRKAGQA